MENKISFSGRITRQTIEEIEEISTHLFASKTAIVEECIRLGLDAFKKARPDIMKLVDERKKLKDNFHDNKRGERRNSA